MTKVNAELKEVPWTDEVEQAFQRVKMQDGYDLDFFRRSIEDGEKWLFAVLIDNVTQGYVILWLDGRDLVLGMAAQCIGGQFRACVFFPIFEAFARKHGCDYVRGHTSRMGMMKVAKDAGYDLAEIIYRKHVGGANGR